MHTLTDFTTYIKGVEYIICVLGMTGFIFFVEILKPKPFRTLKESVNEDMEHIRKEGKENTMRTLKRLAAAPFIGLSYVVSLPFVFAYAIGRECLLYAGEAFEGALRMAGFGWRPMEAYLGGRKDKKEKGKAVKEEKRDEKAQESGKE